MAEAVVDKKKSGKSALSRPLGSAKKRTEPTKRTLNLMIREKKSVEVKKWLPGVIIVLILAVLFGKFAVADRYAALNRAEAELADMQSELERTRAAYADYDEVQEQYNKYTYTGFDRSLADRLDVLALLERQVFPVCVVRSISVSGRTLNLSLEELNLSQISQLTASLEGEELVESVYVSTADRGNETELGTASMTIELVDASTLEGGAAE